MASGALNPYFTLSFGAVLLVASLIASYALNPLFTVVLLVYLILNVSYSFKLKHVVIVDLMILRQDLCFGTGHPRFVYALVCTMLLSLFLAINKRRHELILLDAKKGTYRKVLESYSPELLDQLNSIVTTATIISYSLFTFTSGNTIHLMWTIPLVIYGVFRYLYLIHKEDKGGSPEKVLFEGKHILVTVTLRGLRHFNFRGF